MDSIKKVLESLGATPDSADLDDILKAIQDLYDKGKSDGYDSGYSAGSKVSTLKKVGQYTGDQSISVATYVNQGYNTVGRYVIVINSTNAQSFNYVAPAYGSTMIYITSITKMAPSKSLSGNTLKITGTTATLQLARTSTDIIGTAKVSLTYTVYAV